MTADRALFDKIPEEIRASFHDTAWEKPLDPRYIGPWYFWDQAFGPAREGSNALGLPDRETHDLLLRLSVDPARGYRWNEEHTPMVTYWISKEDLHPGRWDTRLPV
jgi:hypothetical protein